MGKEFPFGIFDLIPLLGIQTRNFSTERNFVYAKCPFCGDTKFRMKLFNDSNSWTCFHCGERGGMLELYARAGMGYPYYNKEAGKDAYKEILTRLGLVEEGKRDKPSRPRKPKPVPAPVPVKKDIASVADRNAVYKALLNIPDLDLTDEHWDELNSRGFVDAVVEQNQYRSFSKELDWADTEAARKIVKEEILPHKDKVHYLRVAKFRELEAGLVIGSILTAEGYNLKGVPGFFRIDEHWMFRVAKDSILIPLRNEKGQIIAMQFRLQGNSSLRYMTVSSADMPDGCAPDELYHFPLNAPGYGESNCLILTEGPLKGDALSVLHPSSSPVCCITGVSVTRDLPNIFKTAKENGVEFVVNALDMDRFLNKNVRKAMVSIKKTASKAGLKMVDLVWDKKRAMEHCEILTRIAVQNGINTDKLPRNVFRQMQALAERLDKEQIPHQIRWDADDAAQKRKGIDDALLACLHFS